jgi:2-amino-4-hydroxy-6-hydroxymethyldihydropteridine diphosphokinase
VDVILLGLGANLASADYASPRETLLAALDHLGERAVTTLQLSRWYRTAPVPASDQPWYNNAVARVDTALDPRALLAMLLETEQIFGRIRGARNSPRVIDLDLIAYRDRVNTAGLAPLLPHPRMASRAFVLLPLRDVAPHWHHPTLGLGIDTLIVRLAGTQTAQLMDDDESTRPSVAAR